MFYINNNWNCIDQNETSPLVQHSTNIPSPENQSSDSTAETTESERVEKFSNNYRSGDSTFPPTKSTPEYAHQQEVLTSQPGTEGNASSESEKSDSILATSTPIPALSDKGNTLDNWRVKQGIIYLITNSARRIYRV